MTKSQNRQAFLARMLRLAAPVLDAAAKGNLKKTMVENLEQKSGSARNEFASLEAVARLLCGMSPWFEAKISAPEEETLRNQYLEKARLAIANLVDPESPDFANYKDFGGPHSQFLVDTAFLSQGILRAPNALWYGLPAKVKEDLCTFIEGIRFFTPHNNNWVLFSTEIEIMRRTLISNTQGHENSLMNAYFKQVESWFCGDGWYSDGPGFKFDYYNSLVIYPMLLDLCQMLPQATPQNSYDTILARAKRHAEILENLVAPDGTYIVTGRSSTYRCGVFHLLAQLAWQNKLPDKISKATAREVLYSVTEKSLCSASFREDGFLNIGICGPDPDLGETYICTGSLYLASVAFLPLGIDDDNEFWSESGGEWTQRKIWGTI